MSQDRYSIYPASLGAASTLNLQQIHGVGVKPDAKEDVIIPGGSLDPAAVILQGAAPVVNFKTTDLQTILAAISVTAGLNCATANSLIQFQKRADGGAFAGGSTFVVLTAKKGFLVPKRLTVSQEKPAELELDFVALYDGSTSGTPAMPVPPLAVTTLQAATSTPAFNTRYYLGPVYASSVLVPTIKSLDVDFGIEYQTMALDGYLWPGVGSVISRKPKLSFEAPDQAIANTVGSLYNAALPGTLAFYLRQGAAGGARTSDATAQHIKLSAATGAWHVESMDGQDQEDAAIKVEGDVTGTLACSTTSTIP